MRLLLPAAFLLISLNASADTRAVPAATREGLVGVWEAVGREGSMASKVYQMVIPREGDAYLVHLTARGDGSFSNFFGRSTAIELADGNIKIRFAIAPEHINYCDWLEIEGYAVAEGEFGAITGKIIRHRKFGPPRESSEPVAFKKGRWIQDLARLSDEAVRIIGDPAFKDGHAVPKENAKSP
jgi:hypothetical protein